METAKGKTREEIINRLADRIDSFEKYTRPHSRLIAELATHLARRFGLAAPDVEAIAEAGALHDIGLYAMSPTPGYLSLPRPLSFEARLDVWRHPVIGEQQMQKRDAMRHAQLLVRWHHEWWNGSGYPDMLAFEDIPIGARILRAVELYAALLSDRPYRPALDEPQALEALTSSAGIECDPYVVKALLALLTELREPLPARVFEPATTEIAQPPFPDQPATLEMPAADSSASVLIGTERSSGGIAADPISDADINLDSRSLEPTSAGVHATADTTHARSEYHSSEPTRGGTTTTEIVAPAGPVDRETPVALPACERLLSRARSIDVAGSDSPRWRGWRGAHYNKKTLLGFQASVLQQIEFRSIAIPFWNHARLDWYLKAWGKIIFVNDPGAWGGTVAQATVEAREPLGEDTIARMLEDVYVPRVRLANSGLRQWFSETDAWWMDNLRGNIDALGDQLTRAQALTLGVQTGDYALSFDEQTLDLRRPLTTVFWRLAGRAFAGPAGQPQNRSFNQPAEDFLKRARADLLYLSLPPSHHDRGGAEARSEWRESWISGSTADEADRLTRLATPPQSKQSYLASIDRQLRLASHFKTWAIEYQEPGLATTSLDIIDLIKEYRPVSTTYSKDVTEVAGGQRSHIIVGEKKSAR